MLYEEFLDGTGMSASKDMYAAYELINKLYSESNKWNKEDAYKYFADYFMAPDRYPELETCYWNEGSKPGYVTQGDNITYKQFEDRLIAILHAKCPELLEGLDSEPHLFLYGESRGEKADGPMMKHRGIHVYVVYGGSEGMWLHLDLIGDDGKAHTIMLAKDLSTSMETNFKLHKLAAVITAVLHYC